MGRRVEQQWVFGDIVSGSRPSSLFIELVNDRKMETLMEVVRRRVRQGTVIMHDGWRSYNGLTVRDLFIIASIIVKTLSAIKCRGAHSSSSHCRVI